MAPLGEAGCPSHSSLLLSLRRGSHRSKMNNCRGSVPSRSRSSRKPKVSTYGNGNVSLGCHAPIGACVPLSRALPSRLPFRHAHRSQWRLSACGCREDGKVSYGYSLLRGKRQNMEDYVQAKVGGTVLADEISQSAPQSMSNQDLIHGLHGEMCAS